MTQPFPPNDHPADHPTPPAPTPLPATARGVIHAYQKYDPKEFPSPTQPPPDLTGAAFEHMLSYGSLRHLTEEDLANAIKLDPSQIAGLGPSLDAIAAMLRERKRKILETYETEGAQRSADRAFRHDVREARPPKDLRDRFERAVREQQIADLERLYYRSKDGSDFATDLMRVTTRLAEKYQVDELASKYTFTGRTEMDVPKALEIKEELETIDKLLEQIAEAMKNARIGVIDLEALEQFVEQADIDQLNALRQQVEDLVREEAARQGLERDEQGNYSLTPKAYRLFQSSLLTRIFADLQASRSGRHEGPIAGEGAVELARTKPYEFGDSAANMDVAQTFINAIVRDAGERARAGDTTAPALRLRSDDIEIHLTKNNPKCATAIILDMSGSMRYDGQYVNAKRMALAMDGLIRREYPGDFLTFVEMFSVAKLRHPSEVAGLMPKPVTIHSPMVRLKVNMADERASESLLPPHFTNIQHALQLARQVISAQDTPNRQICLITDGLPTAHFAGNNLYLLYPPDPLTEEATMREARLCAREGITINVFLLPNWSQSSEDVQFAHRMAELSKGRVMFAAGRDLERFVLWDYVARRRSIIA